MLASVRRSGLVSSEMCSSVASGRCFCWWSSHFPWSLWGHRIGLRCHGSLLWCPETVNSVVHGYLMLLGEEGPRIKSTRRTGTQQFCRFCFLPSLPDWLISTHLYCANSFANWESWPCDWVWGWGWGWWWWWWFHESWPGSCRCLCVSQALSDRLAMDPSDDLRATTLLGHVRNE